ncbi:uncharacterized protein LOC141907196 [Tubulanus polymorphus]|uniref:uncharacterized protein LOC141907196 n=1 Tax=Tubulanus polymorphus TaxID=672921 RepID=UPI003DA56E30
MASYNRCIFVVFLCLVGLIMALFGLVTVMQCSDFAVSDSVCLQWIKLKIIVKDKRPPPRPKSHRIPNGQAAVGALRTKNKERFVVPNIMHYTWYHPTKLRWRFHHLISILSAQRFIKPDRIYFWYEKLPRGSLWRQTLAKVPNIKMMYRPAPRKIFGHVVRVPEHKTDIVRLEAVMKYGGIYTDLDVVILKSFDPLRKYNTTMGLESSYGLCNGIIISRPNATFLKIWHAKYATFNDAEWGTHSVILPAILARKYPHLIHVEEKSLHRPNWMERDWIYKPGKIYPYLENNYAVHTWFRFYEKDHTAEDIKKLNTTLGMLYRNAYYGTMDFIEN